MLSINDACDYIIVKTVGGGASLNLLKLQKLLYYCQAWSLAFRSERLFDGHFQAWVHGPVNRNIYDRYNDTKSLYSPVFQRDIDPSFSIEDISEDDKNLIDSVLNAYAGYTGDQLEAMTHQEDPWKEARGGCLPHERCETAIDESVMEKYYAARIQKH